MSTFNDVTQDIAQNLVEHSTQIKAITGIATSVIAFGLAIFGTARAMKEIDAKKPETKKEKALIIAKNVGPAVAAEVISVVATASAQKEAIETAGAATLAAALANEANQRRIEATKEVVDEKTQTKINERIAQKNIDDHWNHEVVMAGRNEQLFNFKGRYFISSMEEVAAAFNQVNSICRSQGYVSMSEIFYYLHLQADPDYDRIGFTYEIDGELNPNYIPGWAPDGRTCCDIQLDNSPQHDFDKMAR